jgi:hypothetical protein
VPGGKGVRPAPRQEVLLPQAVVVASVPPLAADGAEEGEKGW